MGCGSSAPIENNNSRNQSSNHNLLQPPTNPQSSFSTHHFLKPVLLPLDSCPPHHEEQRKSTSSSQIEKLTSSVHDSPKTPDPQPARFCMAIAQNFSDDSSSVTSTQQQEKATPVVPKPLDLAVPITGTASGITWSLGSLISHGRFGAVHMGLDCDNGRCIAIKIVRGCVENSDRTASLRQEIEFMKTIRHRNIVKYFGVEQRGMDYFIIMEYCSGGSVSQLVRKHKALNERLSAKYTKEILLGLQHLHNLGILHRDIKGANVLVTAEGVAKLADFGCAVFATNPQDSNHGGKDELGLAGTAMWMAPEVLVSGSHSFSSDVWSVGCTVIEMLSGLPPLSGLGPLAAMVAIAERAVLPTLPDNVIVSPECRDFLGQCLQWEKSKRASVRDLLEHDWLTSVNEFVQEPTGVTQPSRTIHNVGGTLAFTMHNRPATLRSNMPRIPVSRSSW